MNIPITISYRRRTLVRETFSWKVKGRDFATIWCYHTHGIVVGRYLSTTRWRYIRTYSIDLNINQHCEQTKTQVPIKNAWTSNEWILYRKIKNWKLQLKSSITRKSRNSNNDIYHTWWYRCNIISDMSGSCEMTHINNRSAIISIHAVTDNNETSYSYDVI